MDEILLWLNQPLVLWLLFGTAITLVLIDYCFPVDWPAYLGYGLFSVFIAATIRLSAYGSLFSMVAVLSLMLTLHKAVFSKYLTNAPSLERKRSENRVSSQDADVTLSVDASGEGQSATIDTKGTN